MTQHTRRQLLTNCASAAVAAALATPAAAAQPQTRPDLHWRVLVLGAHPGDPEAGCGGLMARYARQGHEVTALYLTRGEAGVPGKTAEQAADIRSAEALAACRILSARPLFAGQLDGAVEANAAREGELAKLIASVNPDIVMTQWPIDTHPDHRACASLSLGAWMRLGRKFALYYYEVDLGRDTQCFKPTHYVDVTDAEPLKRAACMAHRSQDPEGFYTRDHVPMLAFRGMECGRKFAEALVHHDQSPAGTLIDL